MSEQIPYVDVEFMENAEPRCPCVILLDTSHSMNGQPIDQLNEGMELLSQALLADELASNRVELAVITFGGKVEPAHEFTLPRDFIPQAFSASGATPMAEAVVKGYQLLEARKEEYRKAGVQYFRPWMFLITDGAPTDASSTYWSDAVRLVQNGEDNKHLSFFGVRVNNADKVKLDELCPSGRPSVKLRGLEFNELFSWLSSSLRKISASNPGDKMVLPSNEGWISVDV